MRLKILNWEKINARKDVSNPSWFKFKHKFFDDPDFYSFTPEERLIWVYLLCETSKKNENGIITVNSEHCHRSTGVSFTVLNSAIKKLKQLQIVEVRTLRGRYADVSLTGAREDKIRLDKIRKENTYAQTVETVRASVFNFDLIYQEYPRKIGKKKGIEKCKAIIKTQKDFEKVLAAVKKYAKHCVEQKFEAQYIKHFSTFMASWEDWVDSEIGTTITGIENKTAVALSREQQIKKFIEQDPTAAETYRVRKELGLD